MFHHVCEYLNGVWEVEEDRNSNSQFYKLNEGFSFIFLYLETPVIFIL